MYSLDATTQSVANRKIALWNNPQVYTQKPGVGHITGPSWHPCWTNKLTIVHSWYPQDHETRLFHKSDLRWKIERQGCSNHCLSLHSTAEALPQTVYKHKDLQLAPRSAFILCLLLVSCTRYPVKAFASMNEGSRSLGGAAQQYSKPSK